MATPIHRVPLGPIPDGATKEQREQLFVEWKRKFAEANPTYFYPDGRRRNGPVDLTGFFEGLTRAFIPVAVALDHMAEAFVQVFTATIDFNAIAESVAAEIAADEERERQALMRRITQWAWWTVGLGTFLTVVLFAWAA